MTTARDVYDDVGGDLETFLRDYCENELAKLCEQYPSEKRWCWVDYTELQAFDPDIADDLLADYETVVGAFDLALRNVDTPVPVDFADAHVWVRNLPDTEVQGVGKMRAADIGETVAVSGQITKVGAVQFSSASLVFVCQRCGTDNEIPQPENDIQTPHQCVHCDRKGPFEPDIRRSSFEDRMLLQLGQPVEEIADGMGDTVNVVVKEDVEKWFTDRGLQSGARVTVTGQLALDIENGATKGAYKGYVVADSIEVGETDYEEIDTSEHKDRIEELADDPDVYDKLIGSLAPDIHGGEKMDDIKLGIVLMLFGGYQRDKPDGTTIRGDSHVLLIGDPSTGKSSLLDAVGHIAPRSVTASGKGATAAGMTAAAVKDEFGDGQFSLEAGALALANGGVAAIDEIGRMEPSAVSSMHAALEQQVISVNKAGINAEIPAQTAVLAAGNPEHDRFIDYEPIHEQIDLDPALLSRFDLAFTMRDIPDEDRDREIAERKVESWRESAKVDRGEMDPADAASITPDIDHDVLRAYIAYAKRHVRPVLTDAAGDRIEEFYTEIRQESGSDTPALAARKLEGIRRLAEAAARVRLADEVTEADVERAEQVIGRSLADVGMNEEGDFDADIVETGQSSTQRDRIRNLKGVIDELAGEDPAALEDVVEMAVEDLGMSAGKVDHELEKLKQKGEVYSPETGKLRST